MSIEQEAQKDLAVSDDDAEGVVGGKKTRKTVKPATHKVNVIVSPGFTGPDQPTQFVEGNMGNDDCDDGSQTTL
jgi:hypothetical protein